MLPLLNSKRGGEESIDKLYLRGKRYQKTHWNGHPWEASMSHGNKGWSSEFLKKRRGKEIDEEGELMTSDCAMGTRVIGGQIF